MIQGPPNTPIPLRLTLGPAYADRYVRAYIEKLDGTLVATVNLNHTRFGTYTAYFSHPELEYLIVTFVVYKDDTYSTVDALNITGEDYRIANDPPTIDTLYNYENRMTTVFKTDTGHHEILCWADRNGQRVASTTECTVTICNSLGATIYSEFLEFPNSHGIYRFIKPFIPNADENYYIIIAIKVDGTVKISNQSFFTLG